jgi:hypothetical protein
VRGGWTDEFRGGGDGGGGGWSPGAGSRDGWRGGGDERGGGTDTGPGVGSEGRSAAASGAASGQRSDDDVPPHEVTWRDLSWEELLTEAARVGPDPRFAALSDAEVVQRLSVGAAQLDAALCRWLELLAELTVRGVWADQGARTAGAWLSWKLGIAPSTAREHVRVALKLREFPATRDRFAAGTLSYSKVRAITRCGVPAAEEMLLAWADDATAHQLERVARGFRTAERAKRDAEEGQRCSVRARSTGLGRRSLTITGPEEVIAGVEDDLRRLAEAMVADRRGPAGEGNGQDRRGDAEPTVEADGAGPAEGGSALDGPIETPVARRATDEDQVDALAATLAVAVTAGAPPDTSGLDRHTLVLHASVDDVAASLADPPQQAPRSASAGAAAVGRSASAGAAGTGPSASAGAAAVGRSASAGAAGAGQSASAGAAAVGRSASAGAAGVGRSAAAGADFVPVTDEHHRIRGMDRRVLRRLACDAGTVLMVEGGDGTPLDAGRRRRTTTAALRRALQRRDRSCTFPGCHATRHLHAHHVVHWADGGPTDLSNLVLICGFHHRFVHAAGWSIEVRPDGRHRYRAAGDTGVVERVGIPPGASAGAVAAAAPRSASAGSLRPITYDGSPYDLDIAVAVLQRHHEAAAPDHAAAA